MTALQAALDALGSPQDDAGKIIAAKIRGLMVGYDARWRNAGWETVSTEEVFQLPVINPETGAASRTFTQAGKFDGIARHSGKTYLVEHKTTSDDIADPDANYWRRLAIDAQVSAYALANWQAGRKLDGTLYDVIRKPTIRPKNLSKSERQGILATKEYFGYAVPEAILHRIIVEGQDAECDWLYSARLASDCVENPAKYFARKILTPLDHEITEFAGELWDVAQSIIEARRHARHYRNSDSCMQYGSPCAYLGICSGYDSPDSANWQKAESVHSELSGLATFNGGRDVLTYSRCKTFQTCRRKAYYRYELGIRRIDEEQKEALVFGSAMHRALEEWWKFFSKGEPNVRSGQDSAAGQCPAAADEARGEAVAV